MKSHLQKLAICLATAVLLAAAPKSRAFALLGPVQPWMQATNGVIFPGDIGGPMCIGNGYRWNVPVVTYGFDQSFLNFFGSNGVAAVQAAIQVINDLPPASQIVLTNYPFSSQRFNAIAEAKFLFDLKSETLSLLLEHLGLANPTRYIFVSRPNNPLFYPYSPYLFEGGWPIGTIPEYVVQRNYDPRTLTGSFVVDNVYYDAIVLIYSDGSFTMVPYPINPTVAADYVAVADFIWNVGEFYTGLTYDDVGGLSYLYSTNNVNYETLLPDVRGARRDAKSFVNGAWRPGVDKIIFIPHPVDPRHADFVPTSYRYIDSYLTNGLLTKQRVERTVSTPDFLFSAGDTTIVPTNGECEVARYPYSQPVQLSARTGSSSWLNNAAANGNTNGEGPGVIKPPVQITYHKLGKFFFSSDPSPELYTEPWASFDGTTNAPFVYPIPQPGTNHMDVWIWLQGNINKTFVWKLASLSGAQFAMQTSTNLLDWTNVFTLTNDGTVCNYYVESPNEAKRFYRLVQQ